MTQCPILLVSAGMERPKKRDNPVSRQYRYLNYGLLGLATILAESGYEPLVMHGHFTPPDEFAYDLKESGWLTGTSLLLLSVPSCLALGWAKAFTCLVKQLNPELRIVAGGRWVVADDARWFLQQLSSVDLAVCGTAEARISQIVNPSQWEFIPGTSVTGFTYNEPPTFLARSDYRLLNDREFYHPSFEVSRGCGMGCTFCAEAKAPLTAMKPPNLLLSEIATALTVYRGKVKKIYFESSFFSPQEKWIKEFVKQYREAKFDFQWRCETRVDNLSPKSIEQLSIGGLKVIDLGLESASHIQLLRMKKTSNPKRYLEKASELLRICSENGIKIKINILLYPGETPSTFAETSEWLEHHRTYISGVSVAPAVVYRYGLHSQAYIKSIAAIGAVLVRESELDSLGYAHLHLSPDIDASRAEEMALELSRSFMNASMFYDLKSFCYFPPNLSYEEFISLARSADPNSLSFSIEEL